MDREEFKWWLKWLALLLLRVILWTAAIALMMSMATACTRVVRTNDCVVLYDSDQVIAAGQQCHVERVYR